MERWRVNLYTLLAAQVFCLMGFGFCTPFVPFLLQEMGVTDQAGLSYLTGLAFMLPSVTMVIASPVWGILSDRFGRRPMILRALISGSILLILMGHCTQVWQFMTLRFIQGIMTGSVTATMSFVSANTPENRISYALGLMTASNFVGFSIGPFLGGILSENVGIRYCFYFGGTIILIGVFLVIFFLKEDPGSFGIRVVKEGEKKKSSIAEVLTPFIVIMTVSLLFQKMARLVYTPFVPLQAQVMLTDGGAATYTGVLNGSTGLATAIAAVTLVRLGDKYDKINLATILGIVALPLAIVSAIVAGKSLLAFLISYTIFYFIAGAIEPIISSAASERTDQALRGTLFGFLGMIHSMAVMAGPMTGSFLSANFGLLSIPYCIPIFTAIQIICILFLYKKKE